MRIVVVGASHESAPRPTLERLSVAAGRTDELLPALRGVATEAMLLSTCSRVEAYAVLDEGRSVADLADLLTQRGGLPESAADEAFYAFADDDAVRHALRVASGLRSIVLGEDQIQAQVKRSIAASRAARALGPILERLGAAALTCGKRVRTFTAIGRHRVSLESLAVREAIARVGDDMTHSTRAVIVGAGESARLVARHLRATFTGPMTVLSRSLTRATTLAQEFDAQAAPVMSLADCVATADMVFCCTTAPHTVITSDTLAPRYAGRPASRLVCVDLGMPSDVDADVAAFPHVTVVRLEELARMAEAHRDARREHVPAAEKIVDHETARFLRWVEGRSATTALAAIDESARGIAELELARALRRLPSLEERERAIVAELAHRIARKLTHRSLVELKDERSTNRTA